MNKTALALALLVACCARRPAESPTPCASVEECTRAYQAAHGAYNECKDSNYGAVCSDEANAMEGAYQRMDFAQKQKAEAHAEEQSRIRNIEHAKEEQAKREQAEADRKERETLAAIEAEKQRARDEAERARIEAEELAAQQALESRQEPVRLQAKRRGFQTVVFAESGGLFEFIGQVTSRGTSTSELSSVMLELSSADSDFAAQTKGPGGDWLFHQDGVWVFFHAPPGQSIYPGTSLTSLNVEAVKIVGVRPFKHGIREGQAFVVQRVY
jgi:hypothetical protein